MHCDLRRLRVGNKMCKLLKLYSANVFSDMHINIHRKVFHGPQFRKCSSGTKVSNACEGMTHSATLWAMTFPDWHEARHHHDGGDTVESGMTTPLSGKEKSSQRNTTPVHTRTPVSVHRRPGPAQLLLVRGPTQ